MDPSIALELYKIIRADNSSWLNLHRQYSQQYATLIIAIMGASLGALYQFGNSSLTAIGVSIGPILSILLCYNAMAACDRYYRHFLEGVTITAKLEPDIGLRKSRIIEYEQVGKSLPFPQDDQILPMRWLNSRTQSDSAAFIEENMSSGINFQIRRTMRILVFLNSILLLVILLSAGTLIFR